MPQKTWSERLWGKQATLAYLLVAAAILLFTMLGSREIWTQEHRWADIVSGMFFRHDFLHPYLNESNYYDKPLLSYWMIAAITYVTGHLSTWALRIPSALAGVLAIWSINRIGTEVKDKSLGLLSGWLLLTTYYFIFWGKTSSADMLNLGGTLFAVAWFFIKRDQPGFVNYAVFFMILAVTSLCKGLVGAIVPLIVVFPGLLMQFRFKKHLRLDLLLAAIPALIVYVLPFWASAHFGGQTYSENGLYLVYKENVVRYFQPFDHKGPLWTYFLWLPIYLLPWAIFFIPAILTLKPRWRTLTPNAQWISWSVLLLFIFFTLSGSRRNYYVLPIVPFAIIITADWILSAAQTRSARNIWAGRVAILFFALLFLNFDILQPLYYAGGGMTTFAAQLNQSLADTKPLADWDVVMLDPESKIRFYLQLPPTVKNYPLLGDTRANQTETSLLTSWPMLKTNQGDVIYVTRKSYEPLLKNILPGYKVIESPLSLGERVLKIQNPNAPVAFVSRS